MGGGVETSEKTSRMLVSDWSRSSCEKLCTSSTRNTPTAFEPWNRRGAWGASTREERGERERERVRTDLDQAHSAVPEHARNGGG